MVRLRFASTSIGTGCPGDGVTCAMVGGRRMPEVTGRVGAEPRNEDWKASFEARFWSTFLAASYQPVGKMSEGLPAAIVATAFWICGFSPLLNFTTKVFGSVYPASAIKSKNSSKYSSTERVLWK